MIESPYYIYELIDPRTKVVCYVGITMRPEVRYAQHCYSRDANVAKCNWINELAEQGLKPIMNILETVEGDYAARKRERYWLQTYVSQGLKLLNIRDMPGYKQSKECLPPTRTERLSIKTTNGLRTEILSGRYGTEGKIPSIGEIMKQFSVSTSTVSLALQFLAGERLIVRRGRSWYVNHTNSR